MFLLAVRYPYEGREQPGLPRLPSVFASLVARVCDCVLLLRNHDLLGIVELFAGWRSASSGQTATDSKCGNARFSDDVLGTSTATAPPSPLIVFPSSRREVLPALFAQIAWLAAGLHAQTHNAPKGRATELLSQVDYLQSLGDSILGSLGSQ